MFNFLDAYNPSLTEILKLLYLQGFASVAAYACWQYARPIGQWLFIAVSVAVSFHTLAHLFNQNKVLCVVTLIFIIGQWVIYRLLQGSKPRLGSFAQADGWRLFRYHLLSPLLTFGVWGAVAIMIGGLHWLAFMFGIADPIP